LRKHCPASSQTDRHDVDWQDMHENEIRPHAHLYIYNIYLYIYLYLSVCLSGLSIYLSIYLYLSISIYIYIYLYLSLSISIYLYLSLSISIYLSIYLIYNHVYSNRFKRHVYNLGVPKFADVVFRMARDGLRSATYARMGAMYSAFICPNQLFNESHRQSNNHQRLATSHLIAAN